MHTFYSFVFIVGRSCHQSFQREVSSYQPLTSSVLQAGQLLLSCMDTTSPGESLGAFRLLRFSLNATSSDLIGVVMRSYKKE